MKHLVAIFSDLHTHDYKQFNTAGARLANCIRVLEDIGKFCKSAGIKTVFFSGDWYDQQKVLPVVVINAMVRGILDFVKKYPDIIIFAISGNHDHSTKNLEHSQAISAIQHIQDIIPNNFKIIDNKSVEVCEGVFVHGIPHYEHEEDFSTKLDERVAETTQGVKNYLQIHQTPEGIGNKMIPFECSPSDSRFNIYDHVFDGHIHNHQKLSNNFTVVGSPIHRDRDDKGKTKGFLVMNLYKPEKGFKFIPLSNYPEFIEDYAGIPKEVAESNFILPEPVDTSTDVISTEADVSRYGTDVKVADIVRNFWEDCGQGDEALLSVGLELLQVATM